MTQQITGELYKKMMKNAAAAIEIHKQEVNELNVFPVPDGDTGTNMSLTIGAAEKALDSMTPGTLGHTVDVAAGALLRGARGNSGVILSLLFRGFAKNLKDVDAADASSFARALVSGVDAAYKAVMKPTEGTILTVSRLAANCAVAAAESESDIEIVLEKALEEGYIALAETINQNPVLKKAGVIDAGAKGYLYILDGMLKAMRGIMLITEPTGPAVSGKADFTQFATEDIKFVYCTEFIAEKKFKTDTNRLRDFLDIRGDSVVVVDDDEIIKVHVHSNTPGTILTEALTYGPLLSVKVENMREQHSEVLLVDDSPTAPAAPVSTAAPAASATPDSPMAPVSAPVPVPATAPVITEAPVIATAPVFTEAPVITTAPVFTEAPVITSSPVSTATPVMTMAPDSVEAPVSSITPAATVLDKDMYSDEMKKYATVIVCAGAGIEEVFRDLGADKIITGGQTMNPSTEDILEKIIAAPSDVVFVLPNNKNIIMAAEQCAPLTDKRVLVIPTKTIPQGISAMLAVDGVNDIEDMAKCMKEAAKRVHTALITKAARDSVFDGIRITKDEYLALLEDTLIISGPDAGAVVDAVARALSCFSPEFITIFAGEGISDKEAEAVANRIGSVSSGAETSVITGNQPVYHFIISAE